MNDSEAAMLEAESSAGKAAQPAGRRENGRQRRVWPEFCGFCREANNHQRAHSWQHLCWRHEHGVGAKRATSRHAVRDSRNSYSTPSVCSERVAATLLYIVVTMVGNPQRLCCIFGWSFTGSIACINCCAAQALLATLVTAALL